jgi:uncharacterized protein YjbI with pentapeptide repeats
MRQDIQKVLDMNKAGTITDDQAAELVEELIRSTTPKKTEPRSMLGSMVGMLSDIGGGRMTSKVDGMFASDLNDNAFSMSRVEAITGEGWVFKRNSLKMSSVTGLVLNQAEMADNVVHMSHLADVTVRDGLFTGNEISASSVEAISIDGSELCRSTIQNSNYQQVTLKDESVLRDVQWNGSSIRELELVRGSVLGDSHLVAMQGHTIRLTSSELRHWKVEGAGLDEIQFEESRLDEILVRSVRLHHVKFVGSTFKDVLFSGGEKWKKFGLDEVCFENCQIDRGLFSECHWKGVTIKDVTLSNVRVMGIRLVNQTICGNEEFLAVVNGPEIGSAA